MTLIARLKTTASTLGRTTLGAALGLGLFASVAGGLPSAAFAQDAAAPASAAAPRAVVPAAGQGPALWVVRDADSTIYLFGTVHVLRPDTAWGSPAVDAAFDASSEIWFEITNPDDQAAALPLIQQYGVSPNRPLSSILTADDLAKLDVAARSIGATAAQLDPMRPWLVALTLSVAPLAKAGYDANSGVEIVLRERAVAAGKPVRGLETMEGQLGILAGLSEETQIAFLRSTLEDFEQATVELDRLVAAWATGDTAAIEQIGVIPMMEASPEVYLALLAERNANWATQIETMLEGSGTIFIAVGAAHLVGAESVQKMLEDAGVDVQRVQP